MALSGRAPRPSTLAWRLSPEEDAAGLGRIHEPARACRRGIARCEQGFHPAGRRHQRDEEAKPEIDKIAQGSFKRRNPPEIRGSGYVVESLEAALWAFYHSDSFRDGCLMAVNLGSDADTTGAVYRQLAGAYYAERGIPEGRLAKLAWRDTIAGMAERLFTLSKGDGEARQP